MSKGAGGAGGIVQAGAGVRKEKGRERRRETQAYSVADGPGAAGVIHEVLLGLGPCGLEVDTTHPI